MNCEVVAIGTELLLGSNVDTNSAWIGEKLAEVGVNSFFHTAVGDNHSRIVDTLHLALNRADAVIVTGGLGPTQDDITREAIAEVMGVELVTDAAIADRIRSIFKSRGREMSENNLRQAMRPVGSIAIDQVTGTAPGLICEVGPKVIYAVPGVPSEMKQMVAEVVLPDLTKRSGVSGAIVSRFLKVWGLPESTLAEMISSRLDALEAVGNPTLAFLAHGADGIHIRISAHGADVGNATALLDSEEAELRNLLGPLVFGVDDDTLESVVATLLSSRDYSIGLAESLTSGMIASRLGSVEGASEWLRGGVVSYATEVKQSVLGVPEGPVVTAAAATAMARGARRVLGADIGLGITGVAGPHTQEDQPVGTVFAAIVMPNGDVKNYEWRLNGGRQRIREFASSYALDALRLLLASS